METSLAQRKRSANIPNYQWLARVYDHLMGDAAFPVIKKSFESALKKYHIHFHSLADIGCGTGTFLHYVSHYGIPCVGVDRSAAMLRIAAEKNRCNNVKFLRQDILRLKLPKPVDLITCNFDTLNYLLTLAEVKTALTRCYQGLTDSGHFMFDMITGATSEQVEGTVIQQIKLPKVFTEWMVAWSPKEKRSSVKMDFVFERRGGKYNRVSEIHHQRWYPFRSICKIIQQVGFRLRGAHDMATFAAATPETFWVKYIVQKNQQDRPLPLRVR